MDVVDIVTLHRCLMNDDDEEEEVVVLLVAAAIVVRTQTKDGAFFVVSHLKDVQKRKRSRCGAILYFSSKDG